MHRSTAIFNYNITSCCCCCSINHFPAPPLTLTRPTASPITSTSPLTTQPRRPRRQFYATISASPSQPQPSNPPLLWPKLPTHQKHPTPYQIFCQARHETYSKQRFYDLVKLYHPDRDGHPNHSSHSSSPCACSREEMLERYRLIVAANSLLSDPSKRDAYNRFGHGWDLHDDPATSDADSNPFQYTTTHRWRTGSAAQTKYPAGQDPMYNATWEDWERWYERPATHSNASWSETFFSSPSRAGQSQQHTIFASNYTFISVIFLLAALGGVGQATRANDFASRKLEQAKSVNEESSRILMRTRQDTKEMGSAGESKDDRIRRFLREKEAYGEGEFDGRALRAGEDEGLCATGQVADRDKPRFWEKPPENR